MMNVHILKLLTSLVGADDGDPVGAFDDDVDGALLGL